MQPTPDPPLPSVVCVWATMGQVCFTAISSNRACPTVFIALSSVFQIIVLCALLSECSMAGVEGQGPFLPAALYQVSCRLLGCRRANMQPGSRPYAWAVFLLDQGRTCRSGVTSGRALASVCVGVGGGA